MPEKVDQGFQAKYCDECSLNPFCDKVLNPHCAKVMLKHEEAVKEVGRLLKKGLINKELLKKSKE